MALSALTDQSLWIPDLKGLLEDQLTLRLNVLIETWTQEGTLASETLPLKFSLKSETIPNPSEA